MKRKWVGLAAVASVVAFIGSQPTATAQTADTTCISRPATIIGTAGDDVLPGTPGDDVIVGLGGNDTITGGEGADRLCGGDGNDRIDGGPSPGEADWVVGDEGNDHLAGGPGRNFLLPGTGDDTVEGGPDTDFVAYVDSPFGVNVNLSTGKASGAGEDTLTQIDHILGSPQNDVLVGDDESNTFYGFDGSDRFDGGGELDILRFAFSERSVTASLATGTARDEGDHTFVRIELLGGSAFGDVLMGNEGVNGLLGEEGNDRLFGGGGIDFVDGGPGHDLMLDGGSGDDVVFGGPGDDIMVGGPGSDEVSYEDTTTRVNVNLATGSASGEGVDDLQAFEWVYGSANRDVIVGDARANVLAGAGGADVIRGGPADDYLNGGEGADTLDGGPGADYCLDHRGLSCEFQGTPGALSRFSSILANGSVDPEELGTATCREAVPPRVRVLAKRPPGTSIAPPARLRPRTYRPVRFQAGDEAETVTWQATLYRYNPASKRFTPKLKSPPLTGTIPVLPGASGEESPAGPVTWSGPGGRGGKPFVVNVARGRYAWAVDLRFESGERTVDWVEPHATAGAAARFRPFCDSSAR